MKRYRYYLIFITLSALIGVCFLGFLVSPSHHQTMDYTPVFAAATSGDLAAVRAAAEKDPAVIKATEWSRATLLHDTVGQNHLDVATYLLDKGADVNAVISDGITALHMAAQNGNIAMSKLLLDRGAKINAADSKGWTPLDRAVKWNHPDAAEFLRQRGGREGT